MKCHAQAAPKGSHSCDSVLEAGRKAAISAGVCACARHALSLSNQSLRRPRQSTVPVLERVTA